MDVVVMGHDAGRGPHAADAVRGGGAADAAAGVRAAGQRHHRCGYGDGRSAGGPQARQVRVIGVPGQTEQAVPAGHALQQFGDVRLADDDRAGAADRRRGAIVIRGDTILPRRESLRRRHSLQVIGLFHADRQSMKWRKRVAFRDLVCFLLGVAARFFQAHDDEGVERRVHGVDSRDTAFQ